ncbi:MAG: hypothetical protein AAFP19_02560 [Bacteroidota bacterium]
MPMITTLKDLLRRDQVHHLANTPTSPLERIKSLKQLYKEVLEEEKVHCRAKELVQQYLSKAIQNRQLIDELGAFQPFYNPDDESITLSIELG